ncbi:MAG: hypothetical protein IKB93_16500 [Clostridia bacterium]|nr:hypothetical protein [Clostridia bacterium]
MKKFTAVLIGAGNRGCSYVNHMEPLSDKFELVKCICVRNLLNPSAVLRQKDFPREISPMMRM